MISGGWPMFVDGLAHLQVARAPLAPTVNLTQYLSPNDNLCGWTRSSKFQPEISPEAGWLRVARGGGGCGPVFITIATSDGFGIQP